MALSIPPVGLANRGDYDRWQMACRALIIFMMERDPRVKAAWDHWLGERQIPMWAQRRGTEAPVSDETADGLMQAILHVNDPEDDDGFQRLVHDDIGIPYIWVPGWLRMAFQEWTVKALQLPFDPTRIPTVPLPAGFPIGKAPRAAGMDIARNVGWLYLTRYWQPPRISIKALAKDYAETVQQRAGHRNVDARKLVRGGIKQAHALLDLARW